MELNKLLASLGGRLGTEFTTSTKPTLDEATDFIHQSMRIITELLEPRFFPKLQDTVTYTMPDTIAIPDDFGKLIGLYNANQGEEYFILGKQFLSAIKTGKDAILLPDYAAVQDKNFYFINRFDTGDVIHLDYVRKYDETELGNYEEQFEPLVIAYSTYLAKFQDEESQDAQMALAEFTSLLQGFGVSWKGDGNE